MNASCGSELTKFILKHSPECRHQSKPLPGAVKCFFFFFFFCLPLTCAVAPQQSQYPAHLICSHYRGGSGWYLFPSRRPWAVYSTCTPLSSLPSATYLFITDSPRKLRGWQTPDFSKEKETDRHKCATPLSNGGHCQYESSYASSQSNGQIWLKHCKRMSGGGSIFTFISQPVPLGLNT